MLSKYLELESGMYTAAIMKTACDIVKNGYSSTYTFAEMDFIYNNESY